MNKSFPKIIYAAASIILAVLVFRFSTADNASKASMFIYPHKEKNVVKKASNLSLNNLQDLNNAFVNIAKSTNPTVVTVYVSKVIKGRAQPFNFGPFQFFEQNPRREQHDIPSGRLCGRASGKPAYHCRSGEETGPLDGPCGGDS